MTDNNICKVCGTPYSQNEGSCPLCGARKGATIPAWLRCKHCGTAFSSDKTACPTCGQTASPRTADVMFLKDLPDAHTHTTLPPAEEGKKKSRKPDRKDKRRPWLIPCIAILSLIVILIAETLIVRGIYSRNTLRTCLELWETDSRIEQNRKAPAPEYHEPEQPDIPDRLFNDSIGENTIKENQDDEIPPDNTPDTEEEQHEEEEYAESA